MIHIWAIESNLAPELKMEAVEQVLKCDNENVAFFFFPNLGGAVSRYICEIDRPHRDVKIEMQKGGSFGLVPELQRPDLPVRLQQWLMGDPVYL